MRYPVESRIWFPSMFSITVQCLLKIVLEKFIPLCQCSTQIASACFLAMLIGSALTIGPNVYIRGTKESNRGHPPQSWSVRPPRPNWYV